MSGRLRLALAVLTTGTSALLPAPASAVLRDANACALHAPEAANRSGLPVDIVLRVMMAESGGNRRAVSPKGAIGCMQIMPGTWAYLSGRYSLGTNALDPRRNMIGGAMYLAELAARYGFPGAYSAYNAGPGRYERYAAGRAALPAETVAYTARIGRGGAAPTTSAAPAPAQRWQEATLFLATRASSVESSVAPTDGLRATRVPVNVLFPLPANGEQTSHAASER